MLPDGYQGPFEIIQTRRAGTLPLENGAVVCRIPTNGVLRADTLDDFRRWHTETARFSSGRVIPIRVTSDPEITPDEVCLYNLGNPDARLEFFVGTHADMYIYVLQPPAQTKAAEILSGGAQKYRPLGTNGR